MQKIYRILPLVILGLTACSARSSNLTPKSNIEFTPIEKLTFECKQEARPEIDKAVHSLYDYALYQDLHHMWLGKNGDPLWQEMAVYYRIAAYNGDYKANLRLQWLLQTGRVVVKKPQTEVYFLNKELEKTLPATAMYKLYHHLDNNYGVNTKQPGSKFAYLRKAADMGSREAQFVVAETLESLEDEATRPFRLNLAEKILTCASMQGVGEASLSLGIGFELDKKYQEALKAYHQGVKAGNRQSAFRLYQAFDKKYKSKLEIPQDLERSIRYKMIRNYISQYEFLQPTVPDLDEIVPRPPAKLPAWDGKIAFQRWFEGLSPAKPADELMQQLAEKAGLDWQTGLPLKK